MRTFFASAFALMMFAPAGYASADGVVQQDGTWWAKQTVESKIAAMQAAMSAYEVGYAYAVFDRSGADRNAIAAAEKYVPEGSKADYGNDLDTALRAAGSIDAFGTKTALDEVQAVDAFYAAHPADVSTAFVRLLRCLVVVPKQSCEDVGAPIRVFSGPPSRM